MLLINELLFQSETGPNYYKEVPLSEILSVEKSKKATDGDDLSYCFEMKTANVVFYVGEDSASAEVRSRSVNHVSTRRIKQNEPSQ